MTRCPKCKVSTKLSHVDGKGNCCQNCGHNPLAAAVALGRLGGLASKGKTSEAKKKASRENGKKGGWPKGKPRKDTPIFHIYQMPRGDWAFSGNGVVSDGYESIAVAVEAARKVREDAFCKIFEQRKIK